MRDRAAKERQLIQRRETCVFDFEMPKYDPVPGNCQDDIVPGKEEDWTKSVAGRIMKAMQLPPFAQGLGSQPLMPIRLCEEEPDMPEGLYYEEKVVLDESNWEDSPQYEISDFSDLIIMDSIPG